MLNIPLIPCSTMSFGCPQFERVSKERQVAQVEYEREKELIDWVGKREATRRFYLSTGSPARLRILFNEAKRLDYEYIQDVLEGIRDNSAYDDFLVGWRTKWNELRRQVEVVLKMGDCDEVIRLMSTMRLFLPISQATKFCDDKEISRYEKKIAILRRLRASGKRFI